MTITLTTKNQITLPKKIIDILSLRGGSLFDVRIARNKIELTPIDETKKTFSGEDFKHIDDLVKNEKRKAVKRVTKDYINCIVK
ncbi:MAG: AbrB/MazE/SpoVT family DNA-binding domain-containing protein [Candidatus Omnitrophica bacterium]|nr:AbrB/MazE/SpoVT family DNA-binding domain-containing protein [Candidatus Omnitrophota bacterium]